MSANELNLLKASAISLSDTRRFQQTVQTIGATQAARSVRVIGVVALEATGFDPPGRADWQTQWHVIR